MFKRRYPRSKRGNNKHKEILSRCLIVLMRRLPVLALCFGLLAFGLPGCSNNPYPPGETAHSVLYRVLADDPRSLDPTFSYTIDESTIVSLIYPSYFRYHYLKRDPFVLELNLGAAPPKREPYVYTEKVHGRSVQQKGESWTFRMRQDIRFQDDPCFPGGKGRAVTAADFIYSFRRMADPSVNCPILNYVADKIIGFGDYVDHNTDRLKHKQGADYQYPVAGLQLDPKDPYTFRILLNQPYPQLRYLMAMTFTTPLAHEAVERYGKELARHPVGCGPFVVTEYTPKARIVLQKNPNRYPEFYPTDGMPEDAAAGLLQDAGKPLPLVDTIVYNIIREGITSWNLFLQGYQDSAGIMQSNFQQVMSHNGELSPEMKRRGVRLQREVSANILYFCFNMDDPVFGGYTPQKRKLRQAISLAIDSQAYIDLFNQGLGRPAEFLLPPGIFGYDSNYKNPYRRYSVEHAKQLLAEAGYANGIDPKTGERLTLYFDNTGVDAGGRQFVALVTKQIEAIGVHLESRAWRANVWQDKVDHGEFQFVRYGWYADYPDAENFVMMLYGPNKRPGPNAADYNNPEYNRLFEQMRSMDDGPERLAIIRKLRDIAVEDCPWIYINHDESLALTQQWVQNVKPHPVAYDSGKYVRVDGAMRARLQAEWNRPNYLPGIVAVALLILGSLPAVSVVRQRTHRRVRRSTPEGR
jgi:ABC-type transport system substrate-binding protein